jgi:hydroxyethylthiazole kinase-like sugar kinase family protein
MVRSLHVVCTHMHVLFVCRLAAERGAVSAAGPGSLRVGLLDHLYQMAQAVQENGPSRVQLHAGLRVSQRGAA